MGREVTADGSTRRGALAIGSRYGRTRMPKRDKQVCRQCVEGVTILPRGKL